MYCYLILLLWFLISGGRCYDISEQCSCSPRQKSDGQWWWQPSEISTYQHHGAVLGKTCRGLSRSCLLACVGEFLLSHYPYHFHILIIAWCTYTGSFRACQSWQLWEIKWGISKLILNLRNNREVLKLVAFLFWMEIKRLSYEDRNAIIS